MNCIYCGAYTESEQGICSNCAQNPKVTVLPPGERENFQGLTIEQDSDKSGYNHSQSQNSNPHIYVRQFSFGNRKGSFLIKLLLGAIFLVVVLVALPIALAFLAVFLINWIFMRRESR